MKIKKFFQIISILALISVFILGFIFSLFLDSINKKISILDNKSEKQKVDIDDFESFREFYFKNKEEEEKKMSEIDSILFSLVQQAQKRDENFQKEIDRVLNDVNILNKLVKTDKELLQKYSKVYFLNEHYVPLSLVNIPIEFRSEISNNFKILRSVEPYIASMLTDANNQGLSLKVQSAYRSFEDQMRLKSNNVTIYGTGANRFSADQGYSEHQLGTTVDFTTSELKGRLPGFDDTQEYLWLLENAHKYGFILSYPKGNEYYIFEPWHWRFVGIRLATKLYEEKKYFYDIDQREIDTYLVYLFE